jgi:hypothetical protein
VQNPGTGLESISNNLGLRPARGFVSLSPRAAFFLMLIIFGLLVFVREWSILDGEIELIFVPLRISAVFGSAIGQHALWLDALLLKER